mmetsp:Transcript_32189/g.102332  ORF Transcript_32189/g.102332 Transcript_32189/m.102332 type:complete len:139 (+) Transcript_32189:20-436(+)
MCALRTCAKPSTLHVGPEVQATGSGTVPWLPAVNRQRRAHLRRESERERRRCGDGERRRGGVLDRARRRESERRLGGGERLSERPRPPPPPSPRNLSWIISLISRSACIRPPVPDFVPGSAEKMRSRSSPRRSRAMNM